MKVSFDALDQVDRLTAKEFPLFEEDEWLELRRYRDFTRDASAETKSLIRVTEEEASREPSEDDEEEEEEETQPSGGFRVDQGKFLIHQFEYMARGWNLYEPASNGTRKSIAFTRENREKFVRLNGVFLLGQMLIRGGGIAPDLNGKVDPDSGKPLTFQEDAGVSAGGRVGEADMAAPDPAASV